MDDLFKKTISLLKNHSIPRAKRARIFNDLHAQLINQIEGLGEGKEEAQERLKGVQSIAHQLFVGPALNG